MLAFLYAYRERLTIRDIENILHNSHKSEHIHVQKKLSSSVKSDDDNSSDQAASAIGDDKKLREDDENIRTETLVGGEKLHDPWVRTLLQFLRHYLDKRRSSDRAKSRSLYQFSREMSADAMDTVQLLKQEAGEMAAGDNRWRLLTTRWKQSVSGKNIRYG